MAKTEDAVAQFIRHAQKYGADEVLRAANQTGLNFPQLVAIQRALDELPPAQKHRLSAAERVKRALNLTDEPGDR